MIIVIDGPAGSGKSSSAKEIARRLNINFLDSGALYRGVTYIWLELGQPPADEFFHFLEHIRLEVEYKEQQFVLRYNNNDITNEIRSNRVAEHVSHIAARPQVRNYANNLMRNLVKEDLFIADGRDLGTVVFPDAALKFYMNASITERAERRFRELKGSEPGLTLEIVKENLLERDRLDTGREVAPLMKADDAIVIDTTEKTFEEQIEEMIHIIENKLN